MSFLKPEQKPKRPFFSPGPTAKYPTFNASLLDAPSLGRSHRSALGIERIELLLSKTKTLLNIPDDYKIALVPGSDTGAFEMAMWSLLGQRGVDVLAWDVFGYMWAHDVEHELKIKEARIDSKPIGEIPDLAQVNFDNDVVFTWNGTTAGVCVPDGNWIPDDRKGLTLCDAISSVFAVDLPWSKLDCTTFSWQKSLGGEAAHGMLVLSPRAYNRLKNYKPSWPIPRLFRLTRDGDVWENVFNGQTINTPSMLCVEDCLQALLWVESIGGMSGIKERVLKNASVFDMWMKKNTWATYMACDEKTRSVTSLCLKIVDPDFMKKNQQDQWAMVRKITKRLEEEKVAFDVTNHKDSAPGIRFWGGPTVDHHDLECALMWLSWVYDDVMKNEKKES